jgi:hypothetical protein
MGSVVTGRSIPSRAAKFFCRKCGEEYNPPTPTGDQFFCCGMLMEDRRPIRWRKERADREAMR